MVGRKRKIIIDWILSVIRWWILILNCFLVCYVGFYPDLCYGLSSKTDWHLFVNESFLMGTLDSWAIFSLKGDGCTYVPLGTSKEITKENFHNSQKNGNMSILGLCFRAVSQYYVCQFIASCMGSFNFRYICMLQNRLLAGSSSHIHCIHTSSLLRISIFS
jgi:hypothetical protein